jgi:glutathionylspermidine synthase
MHYVANGPTRPDWKNVVQRQGLVYRLTKDPETGKEFSYWMEAGHFVLKESETETIGKANAALWDAYIEAGDRMLEFEHAWHWDPFNPGQPNPSHREQDCYFRKLGIPDFAVDAIIRTWQLDSAGTADTEHWPSIYGRYDFSLQLDANGVIQGVKLLEFNADTPTGLLETVIQWDWFVALHDHDDHDQWNSLLKDYTDNDHLDNLADRWVYELSEYRRKTGSLPAIIHVAHDDLEKEGEDYFTCLIMCEALRKAAYKMGDGNTSAFMVKLILLDQITLEQPMGNPTVPDGPLAGAKIGKFFDADGAKIEMIFKLHAWEHMLHARDDYGPAAMYNLSTDDPTIWVEAPYKLLWSNKGFLAILWEFFKDDERYNQYLLPAYFQSDPNVPAGFTDNCVIKPILSREGANVTVIMNGEVVEQGPNQGYGAEGYVVQQLAPLPTFQDPELGTLHAVAGSWMLGDTGAGLCFRVSQGLVTNNLSRFTPHYFKTGV